MTTPSSNAEIRAAARQWFARLLAPDCSDAERADFDRWRAADPAHEAAYREVDDVWQRSAGLRDDPAIAEALHEAMQPAAAARPRRPWRPALAIAATLILAVAASFMYLNAPQETPAVRYATQLGQQRTVALDDGSEVVLDTATDLRVQLGQRERKLTLQRGQADFRVHPDAERPFVVHTTGGSVTATGTQFQVRVNDHGSTVTLLEGQVKVAGQSDEPQRVATLSPNERIVIDTGGRLGRQQPVPEAELAAIRGWTEGNLVIEEWPLQDVLAEMNRYSGTKLRLGDPALADTPISGVFKAGDPRSFAMALEYGWSIRAERRPLADEIVLSRK